MHMKNPSHPGEVFYWGVLEPLDISISAAARVLGVRRATLSAVVNERAALSPDLALRIEKAFGPKVDLMLRIQAAYDAAQVRKRTKAIKVKRYVARAA
jgi:addiction module HigA family antidote